MPQIRFQSIAAAATYPLRNAILRPGQPPEANAYPLDAAPLTYHAGAYVDETLVGVASVFMENPPGREVVGAWRLRGMATLPEVRGQGYGHQLLRLCFDHIARHDGHMLWCNARLNVTGFYERAGFAQEGGPYEVHGAGQRCYMWRPITPADVSEER